jgi:hypothetical protein
MAISLTDLRRVRADQPPRIIIYGPPGMGKTSLAAEFPEPVFLQTEEGTPGGLELVSFGHLQSFGALMDAIAALYDGEHAFRTIVLDNLSDTEKLVWAETAQRNTWKSIEQPGYGKGYVEADRVWAELIDGLNAVRRQRGVGIVLIGHAAIERFDDPTSASYSRYDIDLHKRAKALLEREADAIFLVKQDVSIEKEDAGFNKSRTVAQGQARWIYTEGRPSYTAKSRYQMPDKLLYQQGKGYLALAPYLPASTNSAAQLKEVVNG